MFSSTLFLLGLLVLLVRHICISAEETRLKVDSAPEGIFNARPGGVASKLHNYLVVHETYHDWTLGFLPGAGTITNWFSAGSKHVHQAFLDQCDNFVELIQPEFFPFPIYFLLLAYVSRFKYQQMLSVRVNLVLTNIQSR